MTGASPAEAAAAVADAPVLVRLAAGIVSSPEIAELLGSAEAALLDARDALEPVP